MDWLYDKVIRVPEISDEAIEAMRTIEPVLRIKEGGAFFRRIKGIENIDARKTSFLWDAEPVGDEFAFHELNQATIITQHHSGVFFKPSLAEVYAWVLIQVGDDWPLFKCFCLEHPERIPRSTDCVCRCTLFGGDILVRGREFKTATGAIGHELVPSNPIQ